MKLSSLSVSPLPSIIILMREDVSESLRMSVPHARRISIRYLHEKPISISGPFFSTGISSKTFPFIETAETWRISSSTLNLTILFDSSFLCYEGRSFERVLKHVFVDGDKRLAFLRNKSFIFHILSVYKA